MDKISRKQEEFGFKLLRNEDLRQLWCPELEVIFILKGTGKVYFTDTKTEYTVCETDIFVFNSFEMHNFELKGNSLALSLTVSTEFLVSINPELLKYRIHCYSFLYEEKQQQPFDVLRRDLAKAFEEQYKNADFPGRYFKSKVTAVLEDLSRYFLDKNSPVDTKGSFEAIRTAAYYVQEHYRENITLEDIAAKTFLSKTYISRSFTKFFGRSFKDYVTLLRLSYAQKKMQGNDTLTDIAYASGFPNVNAMIHVFKNSYGITPGEYRKNIKKYESEEQAGNASDREGANEEFSSLMKYTEKIIQTETATECMTSINIDIMGRKQRISSHWKRMINAGYARSLTDGTIQKEIQYLQQKIGFEYIRIKGILDDDMCLLRLDMNGNITMNYGYVDEVVDFILSAGAKPVIELGHMPGILAKEAKLQTMRNGIFSTPTSIEQWHKLIYSLIEHFTVRYGEKKVSKWLFSPWLPPDFMEFGLCSQEEYEEVYLTSYRAIKEVNPHFLIMGPGTTDPRQYMKWYLKMCKKRNCMPDIISFRSFAAAMEKEADELNLIGNNESFSMAVSANENVIRDLVSETFCILEETQIGDCPLVLEEWSNNVWQRDLCNDTCYKSAYLFKNILENSQSLSAMGYFSVNDRIDEVPPAQDIFHGGFGLFTRNDIPKSACKALELLAQMGDRLLQKGDGYFITKRDNEIQIFLYNYCHYDLLYRYRHVVNMEKTNRYGVFVPKDPQAFYIQFENMEPGKYEIRRYGITREGGSSYDAWERMGAPDVLEEEEHDMLVEASRPIYKRESRIVAQNEQFLSIKASLKPLDVWLIKIKNL